MSSIIVLDSSDEDESPPKKANLKITPDGSTIFSVTNSSASKNHNAKQRAIPSGISITARLSPAGLVGNSSHLQSLTSNTMTASYQAHSSIINNERQSPTPPKGQMVSSSNIRKRKTPTPPQPMPRLNSKNYTSASNSSPAKAATTLAPLPPIMPMITGVHSMAAAGATPPLQLMATPPHSLGTFMGLNEQLMINPHLLPSTLPPNTTITAHPNPNQNNINNNFKIHLPFNKPSATTPSPAASPASSAPKTPSPQLTPSPQPNRADKNAKRIKPHTILKSSDESWQRQKYNDKQSQRTPISLNNDMVIEMLPPSTESPKSISASSSRHHTPMTSPSTPKSRKSPDVIIISTPTNHAQSFRKNCEAVLDLTNSPDKMIITDPTEIVDLVNTPSNNKKQINGDAKNEKPDKKAEKPPPKHPLEPEYVELIKACRHADPSKDMEKLIKSKLIKYYYEVHSDYVKSKSFRKNIRKVVESIKVKPDLVYYNLKTIVEELKIRRKARLVEEGTASSANTGAEVEEISADITAIETNATEAIVKSAMSTDEKTPAATPSSAEISATATASTGNKKIDEQIRKLNKALYVLTKRIEVLEQSDVDWDDDDSSYLQVERFKKRACQIYEKICDLTGESKNAHRLVKKPIKFNETRIPQFNKTLQAFINRTKEFPDYFDVLRMLEHCNRTYSLGLVNFEIKNLAEDAFIKVGKLLQSRRKADLYEMVTHFAGDGKDPAKTDPILASKLNENLKNHKKINDILEKFARKQDMPDEEEEEKSENIEENSEERSTEVIVKNETEIMSKNLIKEVENDAVENLDLLKAEKIENESELDASVKMEVDEDEEDDDDDDDDDEEEDEENLDEHVETLANGDISDNESDNEIIPSKISKKSTTSVDDKGTSNNENFEVGANILNFTSTTKDIIIKENTKKICGVDQELSTIKVNSETESLLVNNNNNINSIILTNAANTIENAKTSQFLCPSSPPIPFVSATPTPNGKFKDTNQLSHDSNATPYITTDTCIINTASIASTTMADLKIVHVSSLEPESNTVTSNNGKEFLVNTISSTNQKSLEEIVISDEES